MKKEFISLPSLPMREKDSHKGTFGTVLILAGKRGMSGAAVLSGRAALLSGAGLVRVASPKSIQPEVAIGNPCYTTIPLPETKAGEISAQAAPCFLEEVETSTAVVLGPGLGSGMPVLKIARTLLQKGKPLVLDADALNALAGTNWSMQVRNSSVVVTPHPGEFSRLTNIPVGEIQKNREQLARKFSSEWGITVVLKGACTVIAQGQKSYINQTGNPGMATGGSGDVLAGMIGALLAQGFTPWEASMLGAHIHGLAGDLARDDLGEISLTASAILRFLPNAFKKHQALD
ncbi:MAG: NAD(P)H-hydrate dehydratase [Gemmataceae bacterium]|nr:NAD(P)H-hydrate dehydratase [Gemmataceae bacterium]